MPWTDWQFWAVTLAAIAGAWFVLRPLLPGKKDDCGACGPPAARPRRTSLTVGGTDATSAGARGRAPGPPAS